MDESSEIKPSNIGNEVLENSEINVLNNIPEFKAIEVLPACSYSGDAELYCLKKELMDSDVKVSENLTNKPKSSSFETALSQDIEMDDQIEDYEMASVDSDSDFSNASVHLFTKIDEKIEHIEAESNHLDVTDFTPILLDESLELEKVKDEDKGTFFGNMNSEITSKDLTESNGTLDYKASLNQSESKDETEPSCIADGSEEDETESSSCETASIQDLEMDDQIENYEVTSDDSEWSSGLGSISDASSDFSNASVHSFMKNDEPIQEHVEEELNHLDVADSAKITFAEGLKLENVKDEDKGTFSGNVKSESNSKDLTDSTVTLDSKANTELKQEIKDEAEPSGIAGDLKQEQAEPSCIAGCSKQDLAYPIMKFTGKCKLREANPLEFVVPFIGKKIDWGEQQLIPFNAEIAKAINQQKCRDNGGYIPEMSFQEYIAKRQARTQEEIERDDKRDEFIAYREAAYVLKNLAKILYQMQEDEPNEQAMMKYFRRFLNVPVTPLAMIHIPQFVHTVMYIRSCHEFSLNVRYMAQRCFNKVHVLFPIPDGYNFETVYTNVIQKCLPDELDGMHDFLMEYDEFESESDGEDSAFSDDTDLDI